jgi:hypothetical protein
MIQSKSISKKEVKKTVPATTTSQFKNYTPGTPFGIRKNREKIIKKI